MSFGRKPDLSTLKNFGCSAFQILVLGVKKLNSKPVKEISVGFGRTLDSCYLYNPVAAKMSPSRNVSFNETEFPGLRSYFLSKVSFFQSPEVL